MKRNSRFIDRRILKITLLLLTLQSALLAAATAIGSDVIFESDFSNDTGYEVQGINNMSFADDPGAEVPVGWDAVIATHNSRISVVEGAGRDGGNALKLEWDPNNAQPTIRLVKHLSGNSETGYDELYIRYRVKLPSNFQAGGADQKMSYWKWGRLWQNVNATRDESWTENKPDSGYVVWNAGGGPGYTRFASFWQDEGPNNDAGKGSAGGEHQMTSFFISGSDTTQQKGYFESVGGGAWAFDSDRPGFLAHEDQRYHDIEFRFRLASAQGAEDGLFEMFVDGERWEPVLIQPLYGAPERSGLPTYNLGTGWNFFSLFDNLGGWNLGWSDPAVDGYILIDNIVISTEPIGISYEVAGSPLIGGDSDYNIGECVVSEGSRAVSE